MIKFTTYLIEKHEGKETRLIPKKETTLKELLKNYSKDELMEIVDEKQKN